MTTPRLSICIPTFNRQSLLAETLTHLREVCDDSVEIVVSDNCSSDGTQEVINSFASQFRHLRTIRQSENRGPAKNAWAAILLARGQYLYVLSDDDQIHFQGLQKAVSIMEQDSRIVAVFGGYEEWRRSTGETNPVRFVDSRTDFAQGDKLGMFNRFSLLWHPVCRTDIFRRYCSLEMKTFGMWELTGSLLERGGVSVIPDLLYRHAHTEPRMEYELTENWYHDAHRAQYETFIGRIGPCPPEKLAAFISQRVTPAYIQALRFADIKRDFLGARHFILRARAYGLIAEADVMSWEKEALVVLVADRLLARVELLAHIDQVIFDVSPRLERLRERFETIASKYSVIGLSGDKPLQEGLRPNQFLVTYRHGFLESGTAVQCEPAQSVAVEDLIETCRVTDQPLALEETKPA